MSLSSREAPRSRRVPTREGVILFTVGRFSFAVAASAVQEVRSADSLAGSAIELPKSGVAKVQHFVEHYRRTYFVVNAAAHFGLERTRPTIILILRDSPVALLADRIENMTEISGVLPLPPAFAGDERRWYRGLAYVPKRIVPVVNPSGFLTTDELERLDAVAREASMLAGAL
jgi:chemotaxis signal transduction protein